ncbi:MAG TPA: polysaccharide biosynthesis/export family protein [Candidatus Saccharimonadales bacterium]|nr:polysaccharide biosynthesis/export family protein [Candidatus Saccharimonadales bacterium]
MRSYRFQMFAALVAMNIIPLLAAYAQSGTPTKPVAVSDIPHALRISSGDLLEVSVFDTPELSGKLRVSEVGEISVPIAGAVPVSGMTAEEAAGAVEAKFRSADVLQNPHVSVFISEYASQGVTVIGEVKTPGIYPLLGKHNLAELVAAAGGLTPAASRVVTLTHKADPAHPEVIEMDTKPGSVAARVDVRPGDTITVSRAGVVYVVGDVGKPGGFLIETNDRLTVLQSLALAQGANKTATSNGAKLIRKVAGIRQELPVPLKRILANQSPDLQVEDGDILFVPSSRSKTIAYRGIEAAVSATTGLLIYTRP